jgi:hypothetical protein
VLLACTAFGLAAMHTLGHVGVHGDSHAAHAHAAASADVAVTVEGAETHICGCTHLDDSAPAQQPMPLWSICVAVLTGLAAVVLIAAFWRSLSRRTGYRPPVYHQCGPIACRAPPRRAAGLTVAAVSVLRI